jgi:hypothetical protein
MNIFYLHNDVTTCAEMHNNSHCVKMILEYAQLLSTAHRFLDGVSHVLKRETTGRQYTRYILDDSRDGVLYGATHINHPSAIWVRKSPDNYKWLANLLVALCKEYTFRYGKIHKVEQTGLAQVLLNIMPKNIGSEAFTEPTPAMPDEVKIAGDSIASYRNYYNVSKTHLAKWKSRPVPEWLATT